jgi:hypothetical protein
MGWRTLVVVARPGDRFDCRIAHWGVDADPVGQSRPIGSDWDAASVLEAVDATVEALLVVDRSRGGTTRAYCVCWLDPTLGVADDVALARTDDPDAFRDWWTAQKDLASRALDRGEATPTAIRDGLLAALRRRADRVYRSDDASFLRGDR